jgi:serine/threonine protein kinase
MAYRILKLIGRGIFGEVYLASSRPSNEVVALKIFRKNRIADGEKETTALLQLPRDECFPQVIDAFIANSQYCLAMTFFDGYSLSEVLHLQFQPLFFEIMIPQMLRALRVLHSAGLAHRDIKLENIIFDHQSQIFRLIDFGNCQREIDDQAGTPPYLSETVQREYLTAFSMNRPLNPDIQIYQKNDLFALGVTLYLMIEKTFPFEVLEQPFHFYDFKQPKPLRFDHMDAGEDFRVRAVTIIHHLLREEKFAHELLAEYF